MRSTFVDFFSRQEPPQRPICAACTAPHAMSLIIHTTQPTLQTQRKVQMEQGPRFAQSELKSNQVPLSYRILGKSLSGPQEVGVRVVALRWGEPGVIGSVYSSMKNFILGDTGEVPGPFRLPAQPAAAAVGM